MHRKLSLLLILMYPRKKDWSLFADLAEKLFFLCNKNVQVLLMNIKSRGFTKFLQTFFRRAADSDVPSALK